MASGRSRNISAGSPFLLLGNVEDIAPVAEFGVVFLLFMIGLELSWQRLAIMRKLVFGLGALQVFGSAAALGGIALLLKEPPNSAAVSGLCPGPVLDRHCNPCPCRSQTARNDGRPDHFCRLCFFKMSWWRRSCSW